MSETQLEPQQNIVYTDFQGTGGILVDLNTKQYYQLNETGSIIWKSLENGSSVADIISEIQGIYEVSEEHAQTSVEKLLSSLESKKLLQRSSS